MNGENMSDLEFYNQELEEQVELKKVYNQMLTLINIDILKQTNIATLDGFEKSTTLIGNTLYDMYYNEQQNQYLLLDKFPKKHDCKVTNNKGYLLDYSNKDLIESLVEKCRYLEQSHVEGVTTNNYTGLGAIIMVFSIVVGLLSGEAAIIVIPSGILVSAIFFGIGRILREIELLKQKK